MADWAEIAVRPGGIEPPTLGLEIPCSIRLSYGREGVFGVTVDGCTESHAVASGRRGNRAAPGGRTPTTVPKHTSALHTARLPEHKTRAFFLPADDDTNCTMPAQTYLPGPTPDTVRTPLGRTLAVPSGWQLLPPGDAALTRRVKAAGEFWLVQEKVGRRVFSRGLWAPRETVEQVQKELAAERSTESYAKRRAADSKRREARQLEYVEDFQAAVVAFLAFHGRHADLALKLARAVAEHATPVGSGTVARTRRIPIERRAEAAVIAWMRHQTTGYDSMNVPRVRGQRREVRRMLAQRSKELLGEYRRGEPIRPGCPLAKALGLTTQLERA